MPAVARAEFDGNAQIRSAPCGAKAAQVLASWKTQAPWLPTLASALGETLMRAPTDAIGKWAEASIRPGRIALRLINRRQILSIEFDANCRGSARIGARRTDDRFGTAASRSGWRVLRDEDVSRIVRGSPSGAFFLWTPHKQISVEGLREFRAAARTFGAPVYAVVDPNSSPDAVAREAKAMGLKDGEVLWLDSYDLQLRGFRLHHPSLIVFAKGKWSSPVRRGYESRNVYEDYLRGRL